MIGSRRESRDWARPSQPGAPVLDVLIPTARAGGELATTLAGLAAQDEPCFRVVISDQSDDGVEQVASCAAMIRVLRAQGREVTVLRHLPRRGLAEQRQFLLDRAVAEFVLFLDDDVWLEPRLLERLHSSITELGCGLVGAAVQGISYLDDDRPEERTSFEPWTDGVRPERIRRGEPAFDRWPLHNAANLTHLVAGLDLADRDWLAYRIAWIGGCVLYRRMALVATGGFDFWPTLPVHHSGEDVAAEWRVMERFGGAGILPSGAVHLESPTSIPRRDLDAFDVVFAHETAELSSADETSAPTGGGEPERKAVR